jgi:hypothetical protein
MLYICAIKYYKFYFIMKKVFITMILVAGFAGTVFGQFKLSVGPSVGMNYTFYHGSAVSNSNLSYNGANIALSGQADMKFTPVVGLLTSLTFFDGANAKASITQNGVTQAQQYRLAYIMLNPALKFSIPSTGLSFYAGPGIGFKLIGNSETYQIQDGQRTSLAAKTDLLNVKPRIEALVGMQYDFELGGVILTPQLAFAYGLTDVVETAEWKASYVQFGFACKFPLVK